MSAWWRRGKGKYLGKYEIPLWRAKQCGCFGIVPIHYRDYEAKGCSGKKFCRVLTNKIFFFSYIHFLAE